MEKKIENISTKFPYLSHILQGYLNQQFDESFKQNFTTLNNERYIIIESFASLFTAIQDYFNNFFSITENKFEDTNHTSLKSFLGVADESGFHEILNVTPLLVFTFTVPVRVPPKNMKISLAHGTVASSYLPIFFDITGKYTLDGDQNTLVDFALIYKDYLDWVNNNIFDCVLWKENLQEIVELFKVNLMKFAFVLNGAKITKITEKKIQPESHKVFDPFVSVATFLLFNCSGIAKRKFKTFDNKDLEPFPNVEFEFECVDPIFFSMTTEDLQLHPGNTFNLLSHNGYEVSFIPVKLQPVFDEIEIHSGGSSRDIENIMRNETFKGITKRIIKYSIFKGVGSGVLVFYNKMCMILINFEIDFDLIKLDDNDKISLEDESDGSKIIPMKIKIFNMTSIDDSYVSAFIKIIAAMKQKIDLLTTSSDEKRTEIAKQFNALVEALCKNDDDDYGSMSTSNKNQNGSFQQLPGQSELIRNGRNNQNIESGLHEIGAQYKNVSLLISFEDESLLDYGIWNNYKNYLGDTLQRLGFYSPISEVPRYAGLEYFKEFKSSFLLTKVENFAKYLIEDKKDNYDLKSYVKQNNFRIRDVFGSYDSIVIKFFNTGLHKQVYNEFKEHQENFSTVEQYIEYAYNRIYINEISLLKEINEYNVSVIQEGKSENTIPVAEVLLVGDKFNFYMSHLKIGGYLGFYFIMNEIEKDDTWSNLLPLQQSIIDEAKDNMERMTRVLHIRHNDIERRNLVLSGQKVYFLDFGSSRKIKNEDLGRIEEYVEEDRSKLQDLLGNPYS